MARIVITSWGSYGDVNPYVGLAKALAARGHDPVLATSAFYRSYVERERIGFHPVRPDIDVNNRAVVSRVMNPMRGTEYLLRDLLAPAVRESYEDLFEATRNADLIVTHPITFAGPMVADARSLPWVSTVLAPMSFFSVHELPVFPPAPWLHGVRHVSAASETLVWLAKAVTRKWTRPIDELRSSLRLRPRPDPVFEGQHSPASVLALFSRLLGAPQADWPPQTLVTGHIFFDGGPVSMPEELEDFLAAGAPPVVFTLGTSAVASASSAGRFYQESAAAAARAGLRAVLLIGRYPENRPSRLPDGVIAVEYASHALLFPRAAAIVHQGGIGTTAQALRSGRPMLVVPFAHDQPDNAWRVQRLGVARTLYPSRYRARRVELEVRALLESTTSYVTRANQVGHAVRSEDGAAAACSAIEELC
jgi:UDP:flavonoid glycosyltransferase YjiC (YdhE family)